MPSNALRFSYIDKLPVISIVLFSLWNLSALSAHDKCLFILDVMHESYKRFVCSFLLLR